MTVTQELILGLDLAVPMPNRSFPSLPVQAGRALRDGDRAVVVLGASFAAGRGLGVGDRLPLDGQSLTRGGRARPHAHRPRSLRHRADRRTRGALWVAKDPLLRTALASGGLALTAADLNTGAAVGWRDGEDPDAVALRIREQVPG